MQRGDVCWADFRDPIGSEPGYVRPVIIVQSDFFLRSAISTVTIVPLSSNLHLAATPGNVTLEPKHTGLRRLSVANVTQLATLDRSALRDKTGRLAAAELKAVEEGIRIALAL